MSLSLFVIRLKNALKNQTVQFGILTAVFIGLLAVMFAFMPSAPQIKEPAITEASQESPIPDAKQAAEDFVKKLDLALHEKEEQKPEQFEKPVYDGEFYIPEDKFLPLAKNTSDTATDEAFETTGEIVIVNEDSDMSVSSDVLAVVPDKEKEQSIAIIKDEKLIKPSVPIHAEYSLMPPLFTNKKPKIAIVIDDMGMNFTRLRALADLKGPMSLAFLPYAENLAEQTQYAHNKGHELLVHMPMQPKSKTVDTGPIVLKPGMGKTELLAMLDKGLSQFDGFAGINNHMGSAFTEDVTGMRTILQELKKRGLFFLDSKTTAKSVGEGLAREIGVKYVGRDVFLDHVNTLEFINKQLAQAERVALKNGSAVAIGHPYPFTIEALEKWIPEAKAKGFELVTISTLVQNPVSLDDWTAVELGNTPIEGASDAADKVKN